MCSVKVSARTTAGVQEHVYNKIPYDECVRKMLEQHFYMTGLDVKYIFVENIPFAFFKMVKEVCGDDFINEIAVSTSSTIGFGLEIPVNINISEAVINLTSIISQEYSNTNAAEYVKASCKELISSTEISPALLWVGFWKMLEFIFVQCDIFNLFSYTAALYEALNYIFELNDPDDYENFFIARSIENFVTFLSTVPKYNKVTPKFKLGTELQFIYHGRQGFEFPEQLSSSSVETLRHFVLFGKFPQFSNQPSSVLPFSSHPEDGLILRIILAIYLLNFGIDKATSEHLRRYLPEAYDQMLQLYNEFINIVKDAQLQAGTILSLVDVRVIAPHVKLNFNKFVLALSHDSIANALQYIMEHHIAPRMQQ